MVLAGPGDRRDEDLVAIARAVAGRFDHYICRRDDSLRDRAPDEVPRIMAAALAEAGVRAEAISLIPDEQEAILAALNLGQPGDLLLVFADQLTRSWKQITKFRPAGASAPLPVSRPASASASAPEPRADAGFAGGAALRAADGITPAFSLEGLIRDERGVRLAPEAED